MDQDMFRPIDSKDVKKPDRYDGDGKRFTAWYGRHKDLMMNCHSTWKEVFEKRGIELRRWSIQTSKHLKTSISDPEAAYKQQMASYLRTYTIGGLNARATKTNQE